MKFFKSILFFAALALFFTACQKEESPEQTISVDEIFENFKLGETMELNEAQMDAIIFAETGRKETDFEKKSNLLLDIMPKRIGAEVMKRRGETGAAPASLRNDCVISETQTDYATGLYLRGEVCEDLDLLATTQIAAVLAGGQQYMLLDADVLDVSSDTYANASSSANSGNSTLFFAGVGATIAQLVSPNVGVDILGRRYSSFGLFCDPDDFGDGVNIRSRVDLFNGASSGNEVDYRLRLSVYCKD